MILLIDIGNTNITIGFHNNDEIVNTLRIKSIPEGQDIDEFTQLLNDSVRQYKPEKPKGAVICSVVPETTSLIKNAIKKTYGIGPLNVNHTIRTGLNFLIKDAEGLGADRIANAVAAHKLYKGNLLIVDFGTATTFCVITAEGDYKGGAIMPGLALAADSLAEKTAKLPRIILKNPEKVLGSDTMENILTGLIFGHAGAVERIIKEIKKELNADLSVIATGGLGSLITPYIESINHMNPLLTLEGLKFIYELNSQELHL